MLTSQFDPIQNNCNSDGILVTNRPTPGPPGQRSEILKKTGDKTTQRFTEDAKQ
jgi:hypothetical protein